MSKMFILVLILLLSNVAYADCAGPVSNTLNGKIFSCSHISPTENKELTKNLESFNDEDRSEILESYRGYELVTSNGKIFIPPGIGLTCSNVSIGAEASITVEYACCDGDPNPPCYMGYSEIVREIVH